MIRHNFAVLLAAGEGTRFGNKVPKCFIEHEGKQIWRFSYDALISTDEFKKVILVVPVNFKNSLSIKSSLRREDTIIEGGATRQESVRLALKFIYSSELNNSGVNPESCFCLIHDAARIYVKKDLINRCLSSLRTHQAITCAIKSVDSLKEVSSEGYVIKSLDRSMIWQVQTPQAFRFDIIYNSHLLAENSNVTYTDDASLVENSHKVFIVEGDTSNLKVTFPWDLQ